MNTAKARFLLALCLVLALPPGRCLWSEEPSKPAERFDAAKIPPPNPRKGKAVARVFYDYLYADQLKAAPGEHEPKREDRIAAFIWEPLKKRYLKEHKIEATAAEIEEFVRIMRQLDAKPGAAPREDADDKAAWKEVGRDTVIQWKFSRALYKQYGGTVIFQQGNPREPVGAYRKFLEEMERRKYFEIFDRKDRDQFWAYYIRDHPHVVAPEEVNFDKPWWAQQK